jgi:hypothetical protein
MHITKVFQTIIESDTQDHWQRIEYKHTYRAVFKGDVNLRIESHIEEDVLVEDFGEAWATKVPDTKATSYSYNIYYGATLVTHVTLVSIDGHRALLPLPDPQTMTPDLLAMRVAEIFDSGKLYDYMKRVGMKQPSSLD